MVVMDVRLCAHPDQSVTVAKRAISTVVPANPGLRAVADATAINLLGGQRKMKTCANCGVSIAEGDTLSCYKYKTVVEGNSDKESCRFYIEQIFEGEELLSPAEHLLLAEQTVKSRHMRGVV
jgi:hypothetical protein